MQCPKESQVVLIAGDLSDGLVTNCFSDLWQTRVKEMALVIREQAAVTEKLGAQIAAKGFVLAALLEEHPDGDFGVASLMRRFEEG